MSLVSAPIVCEQPRYMGRQTPRLAHGQRCVGQNVAIPSGFALDATAGMRHSTAMTNHTGFIGETIAARIICR